MNVLPTIIVTSDKSDRIVTVKFDPDIPKVVKYHLSYIVYEKFAHKLLTNQTLDSIRLTIAFELIELISRDQLNDNEWYNDNRFNYNALNFQ